MNAKVLLGSYTTPESKGIYQLNPELSLVAEISNPTYIVKKEGFLYSIFGSEEGCGVSIFEILENGLNHVQTINSDEVKGPCHICVDEHQEIIVTTNYHEACFHVYRKLNGEWQAPTRVTLVEGQSRCHYAYYSNLKNILYITDLGLDQVNLYHLDNLDAPFETFMFPEGSGIRHCVFCKNEEYMYVNAEHSGEIFVYKDHKLITQVKTNPDHDFNESLAAIRLSPDEKFLAVSNRNINQIIVYEIDEGYLKECQRFDCKGLHPRDFDYIDNDTILVANMNSQTCTLFKQNNVNNLFTHQDTIETAKVTCVCVVGG